MTPDSVTDRRVDRLQDPLEYERGFWSRGRSRVCGVDEVGRGPLAGPVLVCAVVLPVDLHVEGARDSKKLSRDARRARCRDILDRVPDGDVSLGAASVREIERLNILGATRLAMRRALEALAAPWDHLVIDGLPMKGVPDHDAVVGGDDRVHSIACASIVAKVVRDDLMRRLAVRYPVYGWERNAGYGTVDHREAITRHGATPHHRRSFLGVQYGLDL
ncbi:MAG TPA: ribonuclease HII [Longimicrobiales bacterium]|nr:ribonuclease HII [Longimicrobiales bacterium]